MRDSDLDEKINSFLDEHNLSPFVTIHRFIQESKLRDDPDLAAEVKEATEDCDLTVGNRISTLLAELENGEEE
jgi:hypothetical protein